MKASRLFAATLLFLSACAFTADYAGATEADLCQDTKAITLDFLTALKNDDTERAWSYQTEFGKHYFGNGDKFRLFLVAKFFPMLVADKVNWDGVLDHHNGFETQVFYTAPKKVNKGKRIPQMAFFVTFDKTNECKKISKIQQAVVTGEYV